jgi:hypothetical protein
MILIALLSGGLREGSVMRTITATLVLLIGMGVSAQCEDARSLTAVASGVDWKVMRRYVSVQGAEVCFYEANGAFRAGDGHVSVWTKCLNQKDLDDIFSKEDITAAIFQNMVEKIAHDYTPPISTIETLDAKQIMRTTVYEEIANSGGIQPHATVLYELDCPQEIFRELTVNLLVEGEIGLIDTPGDWQHIAAAGNTASLLKIFCPK